MKIFKIAAVSIIAFTGLILVVGFLLPSQWSVERSVQIQAPTKVIYPYLVNFKTGWSEFSDFDNKDPDIQYFYVGPAEGVGSSRTWKSPQMGDGQQTIVKADPETGIQFELQVLKNGFLLNGEIKMEPLPGGATKVTWHDWGTTGNNVLFRYMAVFMDKMMGKTFESSLEKLKRKAEVKSALTK